MVCVCSLLFKSLASAGKFCGKVGDGVSDFHREIPIPAWEGAAEPQLQELDFGSPKEMGKAREEQEGPVVPPENISRFFPLGWWEFCSS